MIMTKNIKFSDNIWKRFLPILMAVLFVAAIFGLSGCVMPPDDGGEEDLGQIVIGLTDDEGDFVNYTVDVLYLPDK